MYDLNPLPRPLTEARQIDASSLGYQSRLEALIRGQLSTNPSNYLLHMLQTGDLFGYCKGTCRTHSGALEEDRHFQHSLHKYCYV